MMRHIITYQDKAGEWRWSLIATNGYIVADSSEGYTRKWSVKRAARQVFPNDLIIPDFLGRKS